MLSFSGRATSGPRGAVGNGQSKRNTKPPSHCSGRPPPARLAATMRPISLSSNNGLSIGACLRIPARQTPLFKFLLATFIPSHFLLFLCGPPSTGPYYGLLPSVRPSVSLIQNRRVANTSNLVEIFHVARVTFSSRKVHDSYNKARHHNVRIPNPVKR